MPRGVPKSGFRNTKNNIARMMTVRSDVPAEPLVVESDSDIEVKLQERFDVLSMMTDAAIAGDVRALVVSGPAGLGKSFTVEKALELHDPSEANHRIVKGYVRAPGLFKLLYQHRQAGKVLVFDDADAIWFDDVSINLLKAVCDSNDKRIVSYITEGALVDEESAELLPKSFQFDGTIIFITNHDFDAMIDRGDKGAPHMQAMMSRAHYIDLAMKTTRDYLIRIRQVVRDGLLENIGLDKTGQSDVLAYVEDNHNKLRELSLRMVLKIGKIRKTNATNWRKIVKITCTKGV